MTFGEVYSTQIQYVRHLFQTIFLLDYIYRPQHHNIYHRLRFNDHRRIQQIFGLRRWFLEIPLRSRPRHPPSIQHPRSWSLFAQKKQLRAHKLSQNLHLVHLTRRRLFPLQSHNHPSISCLSRLNLLNQHYLPQITIFIFLIQYQQREHSLPKISRQHHSCHNNMEQQATPRPRHHLRWVVFWCPPNQLNPSWDNQPINCQRMTGVTLIHYCS